MFFLKRTVFFEKNIKEFKKDKDLMEELFKKIKKIQENPEKGTKLKKSLSAYKSIRIKYKYRLIFKVDDSLKEITLMGFGHRKDIYDRITLLLKIKDF